jgi:hypothetical protein
LAVTPQQQNEAFIREVQEEVRRDQILSFWQRYGRLLIGGIVVLLLAYAGALWWSAHSASGAERQGEQLDDAFQNLASSQVPTAQKILQPLAQSGRPGYRALALLSEADIALKNAAGNPAKLSAVAAQYQGIADNDSVPEPLRQLALLRAVNAVYDQLPPKTAIDRLRPIAVPGNPYFASAGELTAIAWLRLGRADLAKTLFTQIVADPATPDSIRSRAVQMAAAADAAQTAPAKDQKTR